MAKGEAERLEELAWWETEKAQKLAYRMMDLEEKAGRVRKAYERAHTLAAEAWEMVYAKAGGREQYLKARHAAASQPEALS